MPAKVRIPRFKSEKEEAEWWDANPEVATSIMSRALKAGTARRGPLKTVTMRLPVADIRAAQGLAESRGLPYQTYIKMLLHQALERELRAS